MSAIADKLLMTARKFADDVELQSDTDDRIVLYFKDVPSYAQQVELQRVISPGAEVTTDIIAFGFSFDKSGKKSLIIKL